MLLAFGGTAFAQQPANTVDANSPFAELLASQYQKYRKAGAVGDVPAYLKSRSALAAKEMQKVSSAKLKAYAETDFDPAQYKLLRVEARSKSARAIWEKKAKDMVTYQLVMFRLEDGEWKIGEIIESINSGDMSKVPGPTGLEQLLQGRHAVLSD